MRVNLDRSIEADAKAARREELVKEIGHTTGRSGVQK